MAGKNSYIGSVALFAGQTPPDNWAFCDGRLLKVTEYGQLYSVLGATYGGDGFTTFGLPDLRGRVPIGEGQGKGLSRRYAGAKGGDEAVGLNGNQMPPHQHEVGCHDKPGIEISVSPQNSVPGPNEKTSIENFGTTPVAHGPEMGEEMIQLAGKGAKHSNMQPFIAINHIICMKGLYPGDEVSTT
ncbi:tail fiber protein [bacterium]|nr:tail fiber protein [bacterium]